MANQIFTHAHPESWLDLAQFSGSQILPLAEPVSQGSIHRLRMSAGTAIPSHTHPSDEYVYVLEGTIQTNKQDCQPGTFWFTPANTKQGPHKAITDVEILTIRLGQMGVFEKLSTAE